MLWHAALHGTFKLSNLQTFKPSSFQAFKFHPFNLSKNECMLKRLNSQDFELPLYMFSNFIVQTFEVSSLEGS